MPPFLYIWLLVDVVSQFLNTPCDSHQDTVICILRYLKKAPGRALIYEGNAKIVCYSDADWEGLHQIGGPLLDIMLSLEGT